MKAAAFREPIKVAVEEVPKPVPSKDEMLVGFRGGSIWRQTYTSTEAS